MDKGNTSQNKVTKIKEKKKKVGKRKKGKEKKRNEEPHASIVTPCISLIEVVLNSIACYLDVRSFSYPLFF